MIKARNSRDLPVTDNPFHNMETLKDTMAMILDSWMLRSMIMKFKANRKSYFS